MAERVGLRSMMREETMVKMPTLEPPVKNWRRRGIARFCGGLVGKFDGRRCGSFGWRGGGDWRYRFHLESPAVADSCYKVYGHEIPNAAETCVFNWEGR